MRDKKRVAAFALRTGLPFDILLGGVLLEAQKRAKGEKLFCDRSAALKGTVASSVFLACDAGHRADLFVLIAAGSCICYR